MAQVYLKKTWASKRAQTVRAHLRSSPPIQNPAGVQTRRPTATPTTRESEQTYELLSAAAPAAIMSQKKSRNRGGGGGAAASGDGHDDLARPPPLQAVLLADSFTLKFRPITLERPKVLDALPASQIPHQHYLVTGARASRLL